MQGIRLSRESINNVLTRHGLNGYPRNYKRWRFFRAKASDELWQIARAHLLDEKALL